MNLLQNSPTDNKVIICRLLFTQKNQKIAIDNFLINKGIKKSFCL